MNSCAWHILRFGQWAKSGPLLLCLLFKWLCTTPAPGVSLSRARRSRSTKTTSGKLPVLPEAIGTFPVFSRDPLLSLFPFPCSWLILRIEVLDSPCRLQKTHFILTGRQRWDGKMRVRQRVSFIVSLNSQVCHTPLNPASQHLVLEILWSIAVLDLLPPKKFVRVGALSHSVCHVWVSLVPDRSRDQSEFLSVISSHSCCP